MIGRIVICFATAMVLPVGSRIGCVRVRPVATANETAQLLIGMQRRWAEADCDGNLAIQSILADDFQGTAPNGRHYTKALELLDAKFTKHEDSGCRLEDASVRFFGEDVAITYGKDSRIVKGDPIGRRRVLIWTDTWLRRNRRWQIIAAQDNWAETE
jgi:uncharacterized protein DUF4440